MNTIDASNVAIDWQVLDFASWAEDKAERSAGYAAHIFVAFYDLDRSAQNRIRNWAGFRRRRYTAGGPRDGWPVKHAIAFGLDNFSGIERGRAEAFAAYLQGRGVKCGVVEIAD
jgi:hypothetical protein